MRILFFIITFITIFGCSRKIDSGNSIIQIQASGVGTMAALPGGRKACYGVSVSGSGIPSTPPNSCNPEIGLTAGFVEAGQVLEVSVPKGQGRKIDVYLHLNDNGDMSPCPAMGNSFSTSQMNKLYYLGSANNVNLTKENETVAITTTFPGETQTLAIERSYPATCTAMASKGAYKISTGVDNTTGGGYKLNARLGQATNATVLTGGIYKLKVK